MLSCLDVPNTDSIQFHPIQRHSNVNGQPAVNGLDLQQMPFTFYLDDIHTNFVEVMFPSQVHYWVTVKGQSFSSEKSPKFLHHQRKKNCDPLCFEDKNLMTPPPPTLIDLSDFYDSAPVPVPCMFHNHTTKSRSSLQGKVLSKCGVVSLKIG